ncbi:MAG: hypothetical protein ACKVXR_04825 [Planctomycetota bacterium]
MTNPKANQNWEMVKGAAVGGGLAMATNAALCAIGLCITGGTLALFIAGAASVAAITAGDEC